MTRRRAPRLHTLSDGRVLAWEQYGDPEGVPIIFAHGSPGSRLEGELFGELAAEFGFRFICTDRPGFGASTFLPDRRLLDHAKDIVSLADELGLERFGVIGWSGGGAHVLASAYATPARLLFCFTLAGYTSWSEMAGAAELLENRLDKWSVALANNNPRLFGLMFSGIGVYARRWPRRLVWGLKKATDESCWHLLDQELFVEVFAADQAEAFAQGGKAAALDAMLHYEDWGFSLADIGLPLHVFHGVRDRIVPFAYAEHLVSHAPGATLHRVNEMGHMFPAEASHQRQIFELARSLV